jgi:hypothetical protein
LLPAAPLASEKMDEIASPTQAPMAAPNAAAAPRSQSAPAQLTAPAEAARAAEPGEKVVPDGRLIRGGEPTPSSSSIAAEPQSLREARLSARARRPFPANADNAVVTAPTPGNSEALASTEPARAIEVHIGSIVVSMRAPAAAVAPAAPARPAVAAAAVRAAPRRERSRFSPSRHYLRWT